MAIYEATLGKITGRESASPEKNRPAKPLDPKKTTAKLAAVGVAGNVALAAFKLIAGILGNSMAMVSDAVHSLSDVAATAIAYGGTRIAAREADDSHPYGHERFECLAAMLLAAILFVTGCGIGYSGITQLASGAYASAAPGTIALVAALVSIGVKEGMYHYTMHYARALKSSAFQADAWHHRSDALSSIGALAGIGACMLGFPAGDALASLFICGIIIKVAYDVAKDAVNQMMDTPCAEEEESAIHQILAETPGVAQVDLLHTRTFGNRLYVDAEIAADGSLPLREAHAIAEAAHDAVEQAFPDIKHIMIHVNPLS